MGTAARPHTPGSYARAVFDRVLVGIDGTEPGLEACRQALRLADPAGAVELVTAVYLAEAALAGWSSARIAEELEREAGDALREAEELAGERASGRLVNGPPTEVLLQEAVRLQAGLIALGTHGHRRLTEILIGGTAGEILHRAPCSVLIARPPRSEEAFPRSVVVGLDGSAASDLALAAADELRRRLGAELRLLVALRGKTVDLAHVHLRTPFSQAVDAHPVDALVEASEDADLVVVGTRGLHGLRALGSVAERVAHRAHASVLVVRRAGDE